MTLFIMIIETFHGRLPPLLLLPKGLHGRRIHALRVPSAFLPPEESRDSRHTACRSLRVVTQIGSTLECTDPWSSESYRFEAALRTSHFIPAKLLFS